MSSFTRTQAGEQTPLQIAMDHANEAVANDNKGEYALALKQYLTTLEHFSVVVRHEKNDRMRVRILAKTNLYLERAETLKEFLRDHPESAVVARNSERADDAVASGTRVATRPTTRWTDIVGAVEAKQTLFEAVSFPLRFPSIFDAGGGDAAALRPWRGILLYGPPGTGKTMLARAAAASAEAAFFSVSASNIMAKYVGESERAVRTLFEEARAAAPSIVFIDEVDSLLTERSDDTSESASRVKTELFTQMDGMSSDGAAHVLVLGTTNRPWSLDTAALRRFERRVYVPLPDAPSRQLLFEHVLRRVDHELVAADFGRMADATGGYSCADVDIAARRATMGLIREAATATHFSECDGRWRAVDASAPNAQSMGIADVPNDALALRPLTHVDVQRAVAETPPSVKLQDVAQCQEFSRE